jgi:DNA-binding NarL/FixJ family response regulator
MKLFVIDRALAFVPMSLTDDDRAALLVHLSGLLDALIALFEAVWARAAPLGPGLPENGVPALATAESRLVLLLRAGLTDEAIARHLGWSARTVHQRIRGLMDQAGAETRFQLGRRAVEKGWVPPPTPR